MTGRITFFGGAMAFFFTSISPALWIGTLLGVMVTLPAEVRSASATGPVEKGIQASSPSIETENSKILPPQYYLPQGAPAPLGGLEGLRRVSHRTKPGDSISKLMIRFGLSENERKPWIRAIDKHYAAKGLLIGKEMHFYFTRSSRSSRAPKGKESLKALEIELDEDWVLTWEKGINGIVFTKRERPFDIELRTVTGVVESTLSENGFQSGLDATLLSQLVDIFSWDIDFDKEVQKGDIFKLLYEEKSRKGSKREPSLHILAAELVNAGQQFVAIYFEKEKGKGGYYDLDGRSLARAFLRFPLEFTSISSYFSHSRFHPILKIDRPHNGVDFVANRGTPIRAIGDGQINFAGWRNGGYGRMIEVQHDFSYASRYAHLQRYVKGIRKGMRVKKGQIIGYVGSSGLATGPHLHFELYKDQQYADPLKFEFPREDKIEPSLRMAFDDLKQILLAQLASAPHS